MPRSAHANVLPVLLVGLSAASCAGSSQVRMPEDSETPAVQAVDEMAALDTVHVAAPTGERLIA